jgi:hypothetical protein
MTVANDHLNDVLVTVAAMQLAITCPGAQGLTTIQQAFAYMPFVVQSVNCPCFVNRVTGGKTNFQTTMGDQRIPSTIKMALLITRADANTNLEDAQAEVLRWRTPVFVAFAAHIRLGGTFPWLMEASITEYTPFADFQYGADAHFLASIFTLSVIELFPITIGI